MSKNDFPTEPYPLHITNPENAVIRARLVDIENINQPGSRFRNSIHIELYDTLEIGRLIRKKHLDINSGDAANEFGIDSGIILCDRNINNSIVFHAEEKSPICKKCLKMGVRLEDAGVDFFFVDKKTWDILQEAKADTEAKEYIARSGLTKEKNKKELVELWNKINNDELF